MITTESEAPSRDAARTADAAVWRRYGRMWRRVPRHLGYLLPSLPIAIVTFTVAVTLFSTGTSLLVLVVGVPVVVGALVASRGFAWFERLRLRGAGGTAIPEPDWERYRRPGFFGWVGGVLGNPHYWLALLHVIVVGFLLSIVSWTVTVFWLSLALSVTWFPFADVTSDNWGDVDGVAAVIGSAIFAIASLPFVTFALVWLNEVVARALLGPFESERLSVRVESLSAAQGAALSAEGHSLRRLERDIHDGPQQRLVRLQMDLAAAERRLDDDPAAAKRLIGEAREQSREALEELRALSRGFAPPILLDRGLIAAIESAADRVPAVVQVFGELPDGLVLPQELERNAYFVASELLANAAKHAGAGEVIVRVRSHRDVDGGTWLDVLVSDDGSGGAALTPGHGLAGLDERVRGLGGVLELDSPRGGPTLVSARIPLAAALLG